MNHVLDVARRPRRTGAHRSIGVFAVLMLAAADLVLLLGVTAPPAGASPPSPVATLNVPANPFIGEALTFTATFDNTDTTDTGFGPYIDLRLPTTGIDGVFPGTPAANAYDGISFTSATYLGAAVQAQVLTFGAGGTIVHPFTGATIAGTPGDQFVVLVLPFGSFTPTQPAATITINTALSNLADVGAPLSIQAAAGFRYGNSPTGSTPIVQSPPASASTTPTLVKLTKVCNCPEGETSTGPNFPKSYTITADIATGQTLTNLRLTDPIPNNLAFLSVTGITPGTGTATSTPTAGVPSNSPGNSLVIAFPTITGTAGANDASFTVNFFAPRLDANGVAVINATTGAFANANNQAAALANWTPIDTRDPAGTNNVATSSAVVPLQLQSLTTRKSVVDLTGGVVAPGHVLEYTIQLEASDFFSWDNVVVSDVVGDGQTLQGSFVPTLTRTQHGTTNPVAGFAPANGPLPVGAGPSTLTFNVSNQWTTLGQNRRFIGGCIPDAGTGGPAPNCTTFNGGATTATIKFRTTINNLYNVTGKPVLEGDTLGDTATVTGLNLNPATQASTGNSVTDDTSASVAIPQGTLVKTVYAINGNTAVVAPYNVAAGDRVTYRFTYTLPLSRTNGMVFTDFLPLPMFVATEMTTFDDVTSAAVPLAGHAKFGPTDTYRSVSGSVPTQGTDATGNSVAWTFPAFAAAPPVASTTDILFTVTASSSAFIDGLLHTNQVRAAQIGTTGVLTSDAIVQVVRSEPVLNVKKGIIATNQPAATFSAPIAPAVNLPVSAPGSAGFRFTGTVSSNNLATTPINANVSNIDGGDLVTFSVVVENTGTGIHGAFNTKLRDTLPAGFAIPGSGAGLNFKVTDGTGANMPFTNVGTGFFDPAGGIQLSDPGPTAVPEGAIDGCAKALAADPCLDTTGRNLAVITYDLQTTAAVQPAQVLTNTATVFEYRGCGTGACANILDPTGSNPTTISDPASATIASPAPTKTLVTTSEASTAGNNVVIGEIARFRVQVRLPEGAATNLQIKDLLPAGFTYLNDSTTKVAFVANGGLTSSTLSGAGLAVTGDETTVAGIVPTFVLPGGAISGGPFVDGTDPTFSFGNTTNADNDTNQEFVVIEYNAIVSNTTTNQALTTLQNSAQVFVGGSSLSTATGPIETVREPGGTLTKAFAPASATTGDAGDVVTYRVQYTNAASPAATAFDVRVTDFMNATQFTLTGPITVTLTGGAATATNNSAGNNVDVTVATIPPGGRVQIDYTVTLAATIPAGTNTNTANATFTSLPGIVGTTPNATGSTAGVAGSPTGERTGADGPGGALNDYALTANKALTVPTTPVKTIASTSETATGATGGPPPVERLAIGEVVRYRLVTQYPEGATPLFNIQDRLPTGLQFTNDNTAKLAFVSSAGTMSSSDPAISGPGLTVVGDETTIASVVPTFVIPNAAITGGVFGSGSDPVFNLGTVTNPDNDANQEFVVVEFNAFMRNDAGNQDSSALLGNDFRARTGTTTLSTSAVVNVGVAEPAITVAKTSDAPATVDQNDTFNYTITVTNANTNTTSPAFDLRILDTLPAGVTRNGAITIVGGTGVVDGSVGSAIDIAATSLAKNASIVITVPVTVNGTSAPGAIIANTANATWTSLPGTSGTTPNPTGSSPPGAAGSSTGERTGSGTSPNDYLGAGTVNVTFGNEKLAKAVTATDKPQTSGTDVVPGETATYAITVTLPEGTTPAFTLTDALPVGTNFVAGTAVLDTTGFNGTVAAPGVSTAGQNLLFAFPGGATVVADNNPANDSYIIRYQALTQQVAGNTQGKVLTNTVTSSLPGVTGASASVTVRRVDLAVTKSDGGASVTPGATVPYTINYANNGPIVSTGVVLTETVPTNSTFVAAGSTAGWSCANGSVGGTLCTLAIGTLAPSATGSATFVVRAVVPFPVGPTQLSNTTTITDDQASWVDANPADNTSTDTTPLLFGTLGDKVFYDANNNGTFDAGEGLSGIPVDVIWAGPDGVFGTGDDLTYTSTTDATGTWGVTRLPVGNFRTTVTTTAITAAGLTVNSVDPDGGGNSTADVSLAAGATNLNQDFGYRGTGSIGDTIFNDLNGNGTPDAGEGINNVPVAVRWAGLDGVLGNADDKTISTTTNASGLYLASGLPAGSFSVTVTTAGPITTLGLTNTVDPDGGNNSTSTLSLTAGQANLAQDFGYRGTGVIGDTIFNDLNGNGVPDPGEGIAGVIVTVVWAGPDGVLGTADDFAFPTITNASGIYNATNLPAGRFGVTVDTTGPIATLGLGNTVDPDGGNNSTSIVANLPAGGSNLNQDFGYRGTGSIGDTIFNDLNGNGVPDVGEGINNVPVTVLWAGPDGAFGTADDVSTVKTTNASGVYLATNLPAGGYRVTVTTAGPITTLGLTNTVDPDGGNDSTSQLTLATGQANLAQDFGYRGTGTIGDTVFNDKNNNGVADPGEGISGVGVTVLWAGPDGVLGTGDDASFPTTTGAGGLYTVTNLPAGNYRVSVSTGTLPAGLTIPTFDADGIATPSVSLLTLTTGQSNLDQDFGYRGSGALGDLVWADANHNGIFDNGEVGIPNVDLTVTWAGRDGVLGTADDQTYAATTNAGGIWGVPNLPAGLFRVDVLTATLPPTLTVNTGDPDGGGNSTSQVTLPVGGSNLNQDFGYDRPNSPPIAVDDVVATCSNSAITVSPLANDSDPDGDPITISAFDATSAAGGTVVKVGSNLVYTPPADFSGYDVFNYTITDGRGGFASATVKIMVGCDTVRANDRQYRFLLGGLEPTPLPGSSGGTYDQLVVQGTVRLDLQQLVIGLRNGFSPTPGQTFDVWRATSMTGAFGKVSGVLLPNSTYLEVQYLPDRVRLVARHALFVDTPTDTIDATPGDGVCADAVGRCSLRAAVMEANALPGDDTIMLAPRQTYTLTRAGADEDGALTGDLDLTDNTVIVGQGATVNAGGLDRGFHLLGAHTLTMSALTVTNGSVLTGTVAGAGAVFNDGGAATLIDVNLTNSTGAIGGGLGTLGGSTVLDRGVISGNTAQYGGGAAALGVTLLDSVTVSGNHATILGGGLVASTAQGQLTVDRAAISGNSAPTGGGIGSLPGTLVTVTRATMSANSATGQGGGLATNGTATFTDTRVTGNTAAEGAGVYNFGTVTILRSTYDANTATTRGGGLVNAGTMTVATSTLSGNAAPTGGALVALTGSVTVTSTTTTKNSTSAGAAVSSPSGATATFRNSIVADQASGPGCAAPGGGITSTGYNLASDATCGFAGTGDVQGVAALLGPLANNGGWAPTHMLLVASPAINSGPATCAGPDQRNFPRPRGPACDKGSIEK